MQSTLLSKVLSTAATTATVLVIFFLLFFLYSKFLGPLPLSVNSLVTNKSDIFSSNGVGKAEIKPDMAIVRAGVQVTGSTVEQAQTELNTAINKVTEGVKALGIKDEDIQTENYNVNPNVDFTEGQNQRITGYSANSNVVIKVKDISKANQVVDIATANGANLVGGIIFDVSDKTAAVNEAREEAVKEAKQNAQQAARVAGFSLGKLINYNEWIPQDNMTYGLGGSADISKSSAPQAPTQVEPGSAEVIINVTLSYEIN